MRIRLSLFCLFSLLILCGYADDKILITNPLRGWERVGEGKTPWSLTMADTLLFKGNRQDSLVHTSVYSDGILKLEYRLPAKKGVGDRVGSMIVRRENGAESKGVHVILGGIESGAIEYTYLSASDREKTFSSGVLAEAKPKPLGEWNTLEVRCQGKKITVFLNGKLCSTADEVPFEQGLIALEAHSEIEFRNLIWQPK